MLVYSELLPFSSILFFYSLFKHLLRHLSDLHQASLDLSVSQNPFLNHILWMSTHIFNAYVSENFCTRQMEKWGSGTVRFGLTPQTSLMQIHFLRTGRKWAWSVALLSWVWVKPWVQELGGHMCQSNAECTVHNVRIEG